MSDTAARHAAPNRTGKQAAAQGYGITANPNPPDTRAYYEWHSEWHAQMSAAAQANGKKREAEQLRELAAMYGQMADDPGAL
jgi:hypothetical protein